MKVCIYTNSNNIFPFLIFNLVSDSKDHYFDRSCNILPDLETTFISRKGVLAFLNHPPTPLRKEILNTKSNGKIYK